MSTETAGPAAEKPVVTIFEHYGAGAEEVGPLVAQALQLPFHPQAFSSEALEAGEDSALEQNAVLATVYAAMGGAYGGFEGRDVVTTQQQKYDLVMENNRSLWQAAAAGGVIVGRNGAVVLATRPRTVHVLLTGSPEDRVSRAARAAGIPLERAAQRQVREDQVRAQMSTVLYGWDPRLPDRYDIVFNTSRIPVAAVAQAVVEVVRVMAP
jgi:cytidylate kinase